MPSSNLVFSDLFPRSDLSRVVTNFCDVTDFWCCYAG